MVWYYSLKLISHVIVILLALWFGICCFRYGYGTEIVVIVMLLLIVRILNIVIIRPESWRHLALWCQSSRGVPVSIWIVLYLWWYVLYIVMHVFSYWALAHGCCFDPQIKVKARWTNHELGGRGRLYMWASCVESRWVAVCCFKFMYLSLDDSCVVYVVQTMFQTFFNVLVLKIRGTPPLNILNE